VKRFKSYLPLVAAVLIGIILQGILILSDCNTTPGETAVEFAKAYYRVDPAMSSLLCSKSSGGDGDNAVDTYIQAMKQEARDRLRGENDYRINLKAELEIRQLHEKVDHILLSQWRRLAEIQEIQIELMHELKNQ